MFTKSTLPAIAGLAIAFLVILLGIAGASAPQRVAAQSTTVASSCTTDSGGYCAVPHDLGTIPATVLLTPVIAQGATPYTLSAVAGQMTATTVKVRAIKVSNGSALAGTAITFSMLALGPTAPTTTTQPTTTTTPPVTTTTPATTTTTAPPPAECALPAYPDASCTGVPAGVSLTVVNGDMTVNTANTIIDGQDIHGCVTVHAPGVVIRNSRISAACGYVVDNWGYTGTGLLIEDSEVSCPPGNGGTSIGEENVTALRLNVHGCENGFDVDKNFTIADSYIHDLYQAAEAHTDGIQMWSTVDGVTIRHNTILPNTDGVDGTSAIISASAGTADVVIQENLMAGGAYTLYCRQGGPGLNNRIIDNHFSTRFHPTVGAFGPWTDCQDEAQVTGNVYHESGLPVPF